MPRNVLVGGLLILGLLSLTGCPTGGPASKAGESSGSSSDTTITYHHYSNPDGDLFEYAYDPIRLVDEKEFYHPTDANIELPYKDYPRETYLASLPGGKKVIEYTSKTSKSSVRCSPDGSLALKTSLTKISVPFEAHITLCHTKDDSTIWEKDYHLRENFIGPSTMAWDMSRGVIILSQFSPSTKAYEPSPAYIQVFSLNDGSMLREKLFKIETVQFREASWNFTYGGGKLFILGEANPVDGSIAPDPVCDLYIIDIESMEVSKFDKRDITIIRYPSMCVTEDGSKLFITNYIPKEGSDHAVTGIEVLEIDMKTGERRTIFGKTEGMAYELESITPDGRLVCCRETTYVGYASEFRTPVVFDTMTGEVSRYELDSITPSAPRFYLSHSGRYILVLYIGNPELWVIDRQTGDFRFVMSFDQDKGYFFSTDVLGPYNTHHM